MTDAATEAAWTALKAAADPVARIVDQFAADPERLSRMSVEAAGLYLDLSKQSWTRAGFDAALALARVRQVEARRAHLFGGAAVNLTEGRAVLHPALRAAPGADYHALGEPVSAEVDAVRADMAAYAEAVRSGAETGGTGKAFKALVHVGIGGSDLGPRVVWDALRPLSPTVDLRFVANIDPRDMAEALTGLDPETTLVVVVSKTFTTQETLANADAAKAWLAAALTPEQLRKHFIGVTAAPDKAGAFGCGRTFAFRDWVGGRYSLWSAVSLSCAIGLGWDAFEAFLGGARAMDQHFVDAPLEKNAPVLLALAQVFNVDGLGRHARTVAPYAHALRRLPSFLQQLEMESNGKRVHRDGSPVSHGTCPVVFGEPGTNGQHAFFQQIHQGPETVPAEFVIVAKTHGNETESPLWANALAQGQALMLGKTTEAARAELLASGSGDAEADRLQTHKTFPGNRPSTAIVMDRLTPATLGALIALYEHKTFVEGVIWDVNSFDQWGVELGKVLAKAILKDVAAGGPSDELDPSTAALMTRLLG
ncbi:glucose-6-phosphate isomerase [Brevundimonas sp. Leaf363]|uniref:glucose-6-phosphate isomerase n=1 Tax=Brevundimonas sp. Leaf363 TaxID=1736353 RepID=UPI0006F47ABC|nr:glucose-6-phosphate isomerase [Brevundimonas sp. Leaf363]KQS57192.1 glucose-6-phosphate isomerase [Brevundimonas sp. Leaf363]